MSELKIVLVDLFLSWIDLRFMSVNSVELLFNVFLIVFGFMVEWKGRFC